MEQTTTQEKPIKERCEEAFKSRMKDIRILTDLNALEALQVGEAIQEYIKDKFGDPGAYGLSLDYVEEGTFNEQREPYIRFQLSYGGPSEEFRIYADNSAEFWFLDWFTGEHIKLDEDDLNALMEFLNASDYDELKKQLRIKE